MQMRLQLLREKAKLYHSKSDIMLLVLMIGQVVLKVGPLMNLYGINTCMNRT